MMKQDKLWKKVGISVLTAGLLVNGAFFQAVPAQAETGEMQANSKLFFKNDAEDLFDGYLRNLFGIRKTKDIFSNKKAGYGLDSYSKLTKEEKKFYTYLHDAVAKIADGTETSTQVVIKDSILLKAYGSSGDYDEELMQDHAWNAMQYLQFDDPYELYWCDLTQGFSAGVSGGNIIVTIPVGADYAGEYEYTVDNSRVVRAKKAKENADRIISENAGKSNYEKLKAYKDAICDLVVYDDSASGNLDESGVGIDPWQMVSVFDGDAETNVVCEGYSKGFQYLCDQSEFTHNRISSRIVTGTLGNGTGAGPHMWNVITMNDGLNYIVDVTNCDEGSGGYPDKLFLAGTAGSVSGGYVFDVDGDEMPYTYDEQTLYVYDTSQLSLAGKNYDISNPDAKELAPSDSQTEEPSVEEQTAETSDPEEDEYEDIVPEKTSILSVKAGKKAFTVKWKKQTENVTGYQIQYALNAKFTKGKKTAEVSKAKTSLTIKKLKAKKRYYVRVRTFYEDEYGFVASGWSEKKSVVTKK